VRHLEQLLATSPTPPAVNQIEVHPRRPAAQLRAFCASHGIAVVAYGSLGSGDPSLLAAPLVQRAAAAAGRTPPQVLLRWALQSGMAIIPKSVHPERIEQFAEHALLGWALDAAAMAALSAQLEDGQKFCWDPSDIA
jgi:2,5-diketo-D-gluconate reductase A